MSHKDFLDEKLNFLWERSPKPFWPSIFYKRVFSDSVFPKWPFRCLYFQNVYFWKCAFPKSVFSKSVSYESVFSNSVFSKTVFFEVYSTQTFSEPSKPGAFTSLFYEKLQRKRICSCWVQVYHKNSIIQQRCKKRPAWPARLCYFSPAVLIFGWCTRKIC